MLNARTTAPRFLFIDGVKNISQPSLTTSSGTRRAKKLEMRRLTPNTSPETASPVCRVDTRCFYARFYAVGKNSGSDGSKWFPNKTHKWPIKTWFVRVGQEEV